MKTVSTNNLEHERIHSGLIQRETQERFATDVLAGLISATANLPIDLLFSRYYLSLSPRDPKLLILHKMFTIPASLTTEILSKLNISIEGLPQKSQQLIRQAAETQRILDIEELDPIAISLHQSKELSQKLEDEYEILKLKQKNIELQAKIDRNNKFLEGLRKELQSSQEFLAGQNPSPDNIQDYIRQLKQKVASYEENCEKAKSKFTKLSVPDAILPSSLSTLVNTLLALREEAASLKLRADDVALAREARDTFIRLRR